MRTITERIAKRIRRGQRWNSDVPEATIVRWAEQYAMCRSFRELPRMQPHTWVGGHDGKLHKFEADFRALALMDEKTFNEYVDTRYPDPLINSWVREYTEAAH